MEDILIPELHDLTIWVVVLLFTAIGVFNKFVYYKAGKRGGKAALDNVHGFSEERADKFHQLYERWGSPLLLLASVPVIGSVVTVLSALGGVNMLLFVILVAISNLVRNWLVVILADGLVGLISQP